MTYWWNWGITITGKQKIETGHTEDGKTVVLSGLNVGDEIVVTGAFYLLDAR